MNSESGKDKKQTKKDSGSSSFEWFVLSSQIELL
jgi:hypothetical protein